VRKQLVIFIAIGLPLISIAVASLAIDRSIPDRISVAENRIRPKFEVQGGSELTIRLKPTKQHPNTSKSDLEAVKKIIENRINGLKISGAVVKPTASDTILVQLPQIYNPQQAERVLGGTAQIEFRSQKVGTEARFNTELSRLRAAQSVQIRLKNSRALDRRAIANNQVMLKRQYTEIGKLFDKAVISGEHLHNAIPAPVSNLGWEVEIEFDAAGGAAFTRLTKQLAGTGRSIGIFLDNELISSPIVGPQFAATGITGGKAVIAGNFTSETANDLAVQISSGALPVPVEITDIRTISPQSR
jgi:preprotein translocase subunit SecD